MQYIYILLALAAAGVVKAQLPNIPSCALPCFETALSTDGCSSITDFACACKDASLIRQITPCVAKACSVSDQQAAAAAVVSTCASVGVSVSIPPITATAESSSAAPASSEAASSVPESSASASSAPVSSPASAETSAQTTAVKTAVSSATHSIYTSSTKAASLAAPAPTTNATSSVVAFTGGAPLHIQGTLGSFAAFLFAAAYYL